nr:11759_t:CDS:2 [Entrophospora candida]
MNITTAIKGHREWDKDIVSYKLDQSLAIISFIEIKYQKRLSARNFIEISYSLISSTEVSLKLIKMYENRAPNESNDPNEKTNIQRLASGELKRIRTEQEEKHYSEKPSFYDHLSLLFIIKELLMALKEDLINELTILTAFKKKKYSKGYPMGEK